MVFTHTVLRPLGIEKFLLAAAFAKVKFPSVQILMYEEHLILSFVTQLKDMFCHRKAEVSLGIGNENLRSFSGVHLPRKAPLLRKK